MDCRVCVLLLSQLNRDGRKANRNKVGVVGVAPEPRLEDLRGSGSIEQDSNAVVLLWPKSQTIAPSIQILCHIAKNRGGQMAKTELTFARADGQKFADCKTYGKAQRPFPGDVDESEDRFA